METMMITEKTTLGELLTLLNLAEKSGRTPTPRELFETAGEPIAEFSDCTLFSNGFAIYQNITGRTVVWLPYCKNFTFYFPVLQPRVRPPRKASPSRRKSCPSRHRRCRTVW